MFYVPSVQTFRPLTNPEAEYALRNHDVNRDQVAFTIANWQRDFSRRLLAFYHSEVGTLGSAAEAYGIPLSNELVAPALAAYADLIDGFFEDDDEDDDEDDGSMPITLNTVVDGAPMIEYLKAQMTGEFTPWKYRNVLYAFWFNHVALPQKSDGHTIIQLRSMPYGSYLKTEHWRRVRCAMLIAYDARCSRVGCDDAMEQHYFGDQADLHVHHKSYANRGYERFEDLELLCKLCHRREHNHVD